jgi:hypothetical protein
MSGGAGLQFAISKTIANVAILSENSALLG